MMHTVYRVENKIGAGMYTGKNNLNRCPEYKKFVCVDDRHENHPLPSESLLDWTKHAGYLFGFESIEALKRWLFEPSWLEYLKENDYQVCEYLADHIYKDDNRQLIFPVDSEIVAVYETTEI